MFTQHQTVSSVIRSPVGFVSRISLLLYSSSSSKGGFWCFFSVPGADRSGYQGRAHALYIYGQQGKHSI